MSFSCERRAASSRAALSFLSVVCDDGALATFVACCWLFGGDVSDDSGFGELPRLSLGAFIPLLLLSTWLSTFSPFPLSFDFSILG